MKILFVVNPVAGKNKSRDVISLINSAMEKENDVKYEIKKTKVPGDGIDISREGLKNGYDTIVAVGGDGTINEVSEGILSMGYGKLGIMPMGTGNDLVRSLGLPTTPHESMDIILRNRSSKVDVGKVGGKFFLNVGSIGFDAEIVKTSEEIKKYFNSKVAYVVALLVTLAKYSNKKVSIEIDNDRLEEDILLVAIGNGKYYGGGMKICPTAELKDNKFDICVIKKISKVKLFFIFKSVFKGEHLKYSKYVKFYKSNRVKIKSKDDIYLNLDGEVLNSSQDTLFEMNHSKIEIIM